MTRKLHPAVFLGTVILLCAGWLWARPPGPLVDTVARAAPRPTAPVDPPFVTLDRAILERYAGRYEGRGDFAVDLTLEDGNLFAQSPGTMPFQLHPTSETEFFLKVPRYTVEFDVATDGTVRGFAVSTDLGLVVAKRVR